MKKHFLSLLTIMMAALVGIGFVACGSDDDGDGGGGSSRLTLSATSISLLSASGSNTTFTITTNGEWTSICTVDWLNLSAKSGKGNATITVTALNANASAESRTAQIIIQCGGQSQVVEVEQKAGLVNAQVIINTSNSVTLTTSMAFEQSYTPLVSYYYAGFLEKSVSAGWTDEKIAATLKENFEAQEPGEDDVFSIDELSSNTSYYICAVAFDAQGNQGPVTKVEVKTAKKVSNRPRVTFGNITYDSSRFYWDTYIGPYASRYYMWVSTDLYAVLNYLSADAMIAYRIKEDVKANKLTPIVQSGSWSVLRESANDNYFYCAAWAQDSDGKFANELDSQFGSLESDTKARVNARKENTEPKTKVYSKKVLMKTGKVLCAEE